MKELAELRAAARGDEAARAVLVDYYMVHRSRVAARRGYAASKYLGRIISKGHGLTPGSPYFALPDGRISGHMSAYGSVALIGVAIDSTTIATQHGAVGIALDSTTIRMHVNGHMDCTGFVEAPP